MKNKKKDTHYALIENTIKQPNTLSIFAQH